MIEPVISDEAFVAEVRATDTGGPGAGYALWWLGQSGFLVKAGGRVVLFDPYLSESLSAKYAGTDKPHVRMTRRIADPGMLDMVDVATSTHNHTDHLDAATLEPLMRANPGMKLVIPEANRAFVAERLGCDAGWPIGLDDGERVTVGGVEIHAVPAAHERIDRDEAGRCVYLGYIVRMGRWTFYHSGDTVRYEGMAERLRGFAIDVAMLPINGRAAERRVAGNLWGEEAAELARDAGIGVVVPCHYEMFEFNTATPERFVGACERIGQGYRVLRCGEGMRG